jgi:flagellar M-ring protein FliF
MDQLNRFGPLASLSKLWNELNSTQRVIVASFGAVSVVTVILIGMFASRPRMAVLFSGLESEDAGAIVQKLSEDKVDYRLSADGSTIEVPASQVYDLRLKMATRGLPQGGSVGFEIFDKSNFGMTEFTEKLNYQRALQGELKRTICQLAPVIDARVHITIPEEKIYSGEQQAPTASVVLKLRRGQPLSDDQVGGVVHLVASAVEGLRPENVTVVDSEGTILSEAGISSSVGGQLTASQSKMKRQFERQMTQDLQSMLARIVGPDKAVVRVSAELSFDQRETKSESYLPAPKAAGEPKGVLLSEEKTTETYSGRVVPPNAGASAVASNGANTYSHTQSSSQYSVTKTIEQVVSAPGKIERLSVAVLLDDKIPQSRVAAISQAVAAAAGIDPRRSDQITVQRVAFDTDAEKKAADEMAKASRGELIIGIAKNAGAVVLLLAFLFFLRSIVRQIKVPEAVPAAANAGAGIPSSMDGLVQEAILPSGRDGDLAPVSPPMSYDQPDMSVPMPENYTTASTHESIPPEVAQSSPEELAKLVRTWLSEDG